MSDSALPPLNDTIGALELGDYNSSLSKFIVSQHTREHGCRNLCPDPTHSRYTENVTETYSLYGVTSVQTYLYYRSNNDSKWLKGLVGSHTVFSVCLRG